MIPLPIWFCWIRVFLKKSFCAINICYFSQRNKALKQFLIPKLSISPKAFLFTLYLTPKILIYCIPRKIIDYDFYKLFVSSNVEWMCIFPYAFNRSHHDWLCFRPRSIETRAQEESLVQVYDFVQSSLEKKSNWKRRHLKRIHLAIHTYYISSQTSF